MCTKIKLKTEIGERIKKIEKERERERKGVAPIKSTIERYVTEDWVYDLTIKSVFIFLIAVFAKMFLNFQFESSYT